MTQMGAKEVNPEGANHNEYGNHEDNAQNSQSFALKDSPSEGSRRNVIVHTDLEYGWAVYLLPLTVITGHIGRVMSRFPSVSLPARHSLRLHTVRLQDINSSLSTFYRMQKT